MRRVYNFSPGPSALPLEVLQQAQADMLDYKGTGHSVMEMSHRSKVFLEINSHAQAALRSLMDIPEDYAVLFLQGGATTQFSAVPLNLLPEGGKAAYIDSGNFSSRAIKEASKYGQVDVVASSREENYSHIPSLAAPLSQDYAYLHITTNNTVYGTHYNALPATGNVPLVADMSSNILGKRYNVRDFSLIYAGAQKNIAPAGLTIVIVKKDIVGRARACTPLLLDYATEVPQDSLYNTPPTWCIYMAGLVFDWVAAKGGVDAMQALNEKKASLLYDVIDGSDFFTGFARPEHRSIMNITFKLPTPELDAAFIDFAAKRDIINIKGYRTLGSIRVSLYNAVSLEAAQHMADTMKEFERLNG